MVWVTEQRYKKLAALENYLFKPPVALTAVRSKAVVLLLLIRC